MAADIEKRVMFKVILLTYGYRSFTVAVARLRNALSQDLKNLHCSYCLQTFKSELKTHLFTLKSYNLIVESDTIFFSYIIVSRA